MRLYLLPFLFASSISYAVDTTGADDDFIYAAERCNLATMKTMVDRGHDVNRPATRSPQPTALVSSYACGFEQISFLIDKGASVHVKDRRSYSLVHNMAANCAKVVAKDLTKTLDLLKSKQMNFNDNDRVESPVLLATRCAAGVNSLAGVKLLNQLLKLGAHVNVFDTLKNSPLHIALESVNDEAVRVIHTRGANLEHKNNRGLTPLMVASKDMEFSINNLRSNAKPRWFTRFEYLLQAGADIEAEDPAGQTPIFISLQEPIFYAQDRNLAGVDTLHKLRHLALMKANVLKTDSKGDNLLAAAVKLSSYPGSNVEQAKRERNAYPVIIFLRNQGVDPDQKNKQGESALEMAARLRLNQVVQALRCTAC